jgi:choline dehydrogenase-like flavoprotein
VIVDGLDLPDGTELRADVVVVGAGPAGIVTALELAAAGIDVVLLESGRETPDVHAQELADAVLADPELHAPGSMTERRQVGGTSVIWGGRCVPFDPIDFEPREWITDAEWPIRHEELLPWFQRSCDWFRCGRAVFDAAQVPDLPPIVPGLRNGGMRASALERWSLPTDFGHEYA